MTILKKDFFKDLLEKPYVRVSKNAMGVDNVRLRTDIQKLAKT